MNDARRENRAALTALIEDFFATMTSLEVVAVLDAAGIANGRLNESKDVWNHAQLAARDKWREVNTPDGTGARAAAAVHVHRSGGGDGRCPVTGPAHRRGSAELGYAASEIAAHARHRGGMSDVRPRRAPDGARAAVVRGFSPGRALRAAEQDDDRGDVPAFQAASGDNHPVHYDAEFCRRARHAGYAGARLANADPNRGRRGTVPLPDRGTR